MSRPFFSPIASLGTVLAFSLFLVPVLSGCGKRITRVEHGDQHQIFHRGNLAEPQDIDPHIVTGVPEHYILMALLEGLVSEDPKDLHPVPGVAERWEISPDGLIYTFHLRADAKWSTGEPVTATDFVASFKRAIAPSLASEYAYMLYPMKNAEAYNKGELTDFNQVGARALNDRTLEITLQGPTPYFLSLLCHYAWFPVPVSVVAKHGKLYERGNRWTRPENFVGNGPFNLKAWKVNTVLIAEKSPTYWDAAKVRLQAVHFYPIDSGEAEERAFRAGQLHTTYDLGVSKIGAYQRRNPEVLRIDPYLGSYFYMFNVTRPGLSDKRVRKALAMSIDRESLVENVTRGGEIPAYHFTPPNTAGYNAKARFKADREEARRLLAEAGFPNGQGFPKLDLLYNTLERHKIIAETLQQMWKQNLNVEIGLRNEEWKVYMDSKRQRNFDIVRYGWIGDYVDPNSFLDLWITGGGNNDTGWSNPEYDRLLRAAGQTGDNAERFEFFQQAESILLDELPVLPIYFYTRPFLLAKSVRGWHVNILNIHPYKHVYLEPN
jgi:oligopeptide transport system substrate-binding protein